MSALDWRTESVDDEGFEEIISGCDPLVAVVRMKSKWRMRSREFDHSKAAENKCDVLEGSMEV